MEERSRFRVRVYTPGKGHRDIDELHTRQAAERTAFSAAQERDGRTEVDVIVNMPVVVSRFTVGAPDGIAMTCPYLACPTEVPK